MRRWHLWIALAVAIVALAVNVGAATAYFYDSARGDVVAQGVTIGGLPIGGLSATQATAVLQQRLVPRLQQPLTLEYGTRTFTFDPHGAYLHVHVAAMVDRAVRLSREGSLFTRVVRDVRGQRVDEGVAVEAAFSHYAVQRFVTRIAQRIDRPARAARVIPGPSSLARRPSRDGVRVDQDALAQLVTQRLLDGRGLRHLAVPTTVIHAKVTLASLPRRYPTYITVDRARFRLTFWRHLKPYKHYTVAIGRQGLETPAGVYTIDNKQVNPSWHVPLSAWAGDLAGKVIPPGPDDPIKARWMGFYNGAGIHGTDAVYSLGTAASHGCIRMAIPDVEQLYDLVPLGTPIYVG